MQCVRNQIVVILLAVSAIACVCHPVASGADWPNWRGPNHDGKSPDSGLLGGWPAGGPKLLWKTDGLGKGFSNVAVVGDRIYTTGDVDGKLVIFSLDSTGELFWKVDADDAWSKNHPGSRSTPTIDGDRLYLLSGHGQLGCYDAANGRVVWTRSAKDFGGKPGGWGYAESVLILGNLAIFKPGGAQCIAALDKRTGRTVWTSSGFSAGPEYSSCLPIEFAGRTILVTGTRAGLVCVDAADGSLQWMNDWSANNTANCPTPAYSDGYVFWANGYNKGGICLKLKTAGERVDADVAWTTEDMVCHHGGYVIQDGCIYGNHSGGYSCLELKTGKVLWNQRAVGKGSLCWADGMLYLFGERGGAAALGTCSPTGLEIRGETAVEGEGPSWAHPVVINGRLYLRYDANLYCFDVQQR